LKRELDRWKEDIKVQESKATLSAGKLKSEVDAHRETREKLDKTITHLSDTRSEIDKTRQECAEFMKRLKGDEDAKQKRARVAEKEQSVKLMIDAAAATELDCLREKYTKVIAEYDILSSKTESMEKERLEHEALLSKLKDTSEVQKREIVDLITQVAEMESLRMGLSSEEEKVWTSRAEVETLRSDLIEVTNDMDSCRRKEADLLEFTQKLTEKNVTLQSELAFIEGRASALESEHTRLANNVSELEAANTQLRVQLESEAKHRKSETEALAKKLAETTKLFDSTRQQVIDAENEVSVLKRKNQASLRELMRELKECQRKLDAQPATLNLSPTVLSQSSRASSNSSLNRVGNNNVDDASSSPTMSVSSNLSFTNGNMRSSPHVVQVNII
jgi:chromosome segregation ATPase